MVVVYIPVREKLQSILDGNTRPVSDIGGQRLDIRPGILDVAGGKVAIELTQGATDVSVLAESEVTGELEPHLVARTVATVLASVDRCYWHGP